MNSLDDKNIKEKRQIPKQYTPFMIYVIDCLCCYSCNTCMNNTIDYLFYGKSKK